jgi:hypothetical protein
MIDQTVVELSRLQFALTAMYHFLFVPLTLGLSFMVAIMESVYVMTGKEIWRRMTLFWGVLFGINFAMGVATGIVIGTRSSTSLRFGRSSGASLLPERVQGLVQLDQRLSYELHPPVLAGQGVEDGPVEHEHRMHLAAGAQGVVEGSVVLRPQVAAEPQDQGGRHG